MNCLRPILPLLVTSLFVVNGSAYAANTHTFGKTAMSGEQTYNAVCATCHRGGLLHSPKAGDAKA